MIRASRREALIGALAVPAAGALPLTARASTGTPILLHDPKLAAGRRFAAAAAAKGEGAVAIEGDAIRFARMIFARQPTLVVGVTRRADALLIEEVGREAGYRAVAPPVSTGSDAWALARVS